MTAGFLLCLSKKRFAFGPESGESRRSELPLPLIGSCARLGYLVG